MGLINNLVVFVAGTKALASQINQNFEILRVAHNVNDARIDNLEADFSSVEGNFIKKDGSVAFTANVNANSHKIINVAEGTDDNDAVNKAQLDLKENIVTGSIIYFTKNTPPAGYLECNGAAISRTAYAALFEVIGTTFGAGDGSTTFELPDLRGVFVRGWDHGRGYDSDRIFGSNQADDFKSHQHFIANTTNGGSPAYNVTLTSTNYLRSATPGSTDWAYNLQGSNDVATIGLTSSTGGTETRPRNVALLACIRY